MLRSQSVSQLRVCSNGLWVRGDRCVVKKHAKGVFDSTATSRIGVGISVESFVNVNESWMMTVIACFLHFDVVPACPSLLLIAPNLPQMSLSWGSAVSSFV